MSIQLNESGFRLNGHAIAESYSCEKVRHYEIELILLLNKLNDQSNNSQAYLEKCKLLLDREFERLLNIRPEHQTSQKAFKAFLEEEELPEERISQLIEIYQQVSKQKKMQNLLKRIEEFLQGDFKNKSSAEVYKISKEFRDDLKDYPNGHYKKLAEVLLAIRINNQAWALKLLIEFFNQHPARVGFDLYRQVFDHEWTTERHHRLILNIGIEITKFFKKTHPEEMDIFITTLEHTVDSRIFASLSQGFGTDWSLARLRESVAKGERARQYPSFWFSQLSYRTSSGQTDLFLRGLFQNTKRYPLSADSLWIFAETFPRLEQEREHLVDVAQKSYSQDFYYQYLILQLLDHAPFKKMMEDVQESFSRPLFQLRRQYLRYGIENFYAPEWMLYELLKLGDYQKDYLWYIGLHPNMKVKHVPQNDSES